MGQVDLGLEGEFPAPDARWERTVLLDWGPVPGSYGWVFPKGDVLTVGVIGSRDQSAALRTYYAELVERLGLSGITPLVQTGHLTRVRTPDSPLRRGAVLVAGDAAGLLEPWTREGISFALRSGRLAGEAAARGRLEAYPLAVDRVLGAGDRRRPRAAARLRRVTRRSFTPCSPGRASASSGGSWTAAAPSPASSAVPAPPGPCTALARAVAGDGAAHAARAAAS